MEINLRRKKWLLFCNFNPRKSLIKDYFTRISKQRDSLSTKYDSILILSNFSSKESMTTFCHIYGLKSTINETTCYNNPNNPTCIDLSTTKPQHVRNQTIRFPQNDPGCIKSLVQKTKTQNLELSQI